MSEANSMVALLGGRLAVDFANAPSYPGAPFGALSWEELVYFLEVSNVISKERGVTLLALPQNDPRTAQALLLRATRLRDALREAFGALVREEPITNNWVEPINAVLRITEGHDELVQHSGAWRLEFVAREGGLDWLLAAVARS